MSTLFKFIFKYNSRLSLDVCFYPLLLLALLFKYSSVYGLDFTYLGILKWSSVYSSIVWTSLIACFYIIQMVKCLLVHGLDFTYCMFSFYSFISHQRVYVGGLFFRPLLFVTLRFCFILWCFVVHDCCLRTFMNDTSLHLEILLIYGFQPFFWTFNFIMD